MSEIEVFVAISNNDVFAGIMHTHQRRARESATFQYDSAYLAKPDAYALDPALPLVSGALQTPATLDMFNAFRDSAPDRWGRTLIARQARHRAKASGNRTASPTEFDYLVGVRDDVRQGALRFRDPATQAFLAANDVGVPALTDLAELLNIAERVESESAAEAEIRRLVRAGSSLGGARPKVHVRARDGRLAIAKFPSLGIDTWNVMAWEKVALELADRSGIEVADSQLVDVGGRAVLISYRFDRTSDNWRIGYASALTMLEAKNGDQRSYLDIGEVVEIHSPHASRDLAQLWRRMLFSVLISNSDDHLRNHAFLHTTGDSWRLSPAFDINPNPEPGATHLSTAINDSGTEARLDVLLDVAPFFRLTPDTVATVVREVWFEVKKWKAVATHFGLSTAEIAQMEPAFDHRAAEEAASV